MYSFAHVRLVPGGATGNLFAGDILGRGVSSVLPIQDARVHEAHAVVSFREGELCLLPARGTLYPAGEPPTRQPVVLRKGLMCGLRADGRLAVEVLEVHLSAGTLGLRLGDGAPIALRRGVTYTLRPGAESWLTPGAHGDEPLVWMEGEDWFVGVAGEVVPLEAHTVVDLPGGAPLTVVEMDHSVAPTGGSTLDTRGLATGRGVRFRVGVGPVPAEWVVEATGASGPPIARLDGTCAYLVGRLLLAARDGDTSLASRELAEALWPAQARQGYPAKHVFDVRRRACVWLAALPGGGRRIEVVGRGRVALALVDGDTLVPGTHA